MSEAKKDTFKEHIEGILFSEGPDIFYDIRDAVLKEPDLLDDLSERDWAFLIMLYGSKGKFLADIIQSVKDDPALLEELEEG